MNSINFAQNHIVDQQSAQPYLLQNEKHSPQGLINLLDRDPDFTTNYPITLYIEGDTSVEDFERIANKFKNISIITTTEIDNNTIMNIFNIFKKHSLTMIYILSSNITNETLAILQNYDIKVIQLAECSEVTFTEEFYQDKFPKLEQLIFVSCQKVTHAEVWEKEIQREPQPSYRLAVQEWTPESGVSKIARRFSI